MSHTMRDSVRSYPWWSRALDVKLAIGRAITREMSALRFWPALWLALLTAALHLYANGGYGYHRDELYFNVISRTCAVVDSGVIQRRKP